MHFHNIKLDENYSLHLCINEIYDKHFYYMIDIDLYMNMSLLFQNFCKQCQVL